MTQQAEITTVQRDEPGLTVQLEALAPVTSTTHSGEPKRGPWTLDVLERTLFEFRAAGAWDGAEVEFTSGHGWNHGTGVKCEILAGRGADAMPWGWRPSQGPPPPSLPETLPSPAAGTGLRDRSRLVDVLGNRVFHGFLLLLLVVLAVAR